MAARPLRYALINVAPPTVNINYYERRFMSDRCKMSCAECRHCRVASVQGCIVMSLSSAGCRLFHGRLNTHCSEDDARYS